MYNTEGVVGEALQLAFKSGLVEREDVFVTTKLSPADTQPANVLPSLQKSLRLGTLNPLSCRILNTQLVRDDSQIQIVYIAISLIVFRTHLNIIMR
jgi:diketogulonate reductase-like aldo/keto reductase